MWKQLPDQLRNTGHSKIESECEVVSPFVKTIIFQVASIRTGSACFGLFFRCFVEVVHVVT